MYKNINDLKEKILKIIIAFPNPCSNVIEKLISSRQGIIKFAIVCDTLGFNYSKQIFEKISQSNWDEMEDLVNTSSFKFLKSSTPTILNEVYLECIDASMDENFLESYTDPFHFLKTMNKTELQTLFKQEEPAVLSLISLFKSPEEMTELFKAIPIQTRSIVLLQMNQIKMMPRHTAQELAVRCAHRLFIQLKNIREKSFSTFQIKKTISTYPLCYFDLDHELIQFVQSTQHLTDITPLLTEYSNLIKESEILIQKNQDS